MFLQPAATHHQISQDDVQVAIAKALSVMTIDVDKNSSGADSIRHLFLQAKQPAGMHVSLKTVKMDFRKLLSLCAELMIGASGTSIWMLLRLAPYCLSWRNLKVSSTKSIKMWRQSFGA
ncbi:MAG: hypothetical protein R3A44_27230 [Caldilineaceae bacterium]